MATAYTITAAASVVPLPSPIQRRTLRNTGANAIFWRAGAVLNGFAGTASQLRALADGELRPGNAVTLDASVDQVVAVCATGLASALDVTGGLQAASPPSALPGGTKVVGAATVQLTDIATPCRMVWLGASIVVDTGLPLNVRTVLVGDATNRTLPLTPYNFEGVFIPIDDASKLWLTGANANDAVAYRVFA